MIKQEDKTLMMLVADVHRQFGHRVRDLEKKNGFGPCVNCILFELDYNTSLTQVDIVEKIHMRPSSISVALQKMESDGLIERKVKDDDQRYTVVCITEKGKKICTEIKKSVKEMDDVFTSKLNQKEAELAKKVLLDLSKILQEVDE